MSDSSGPGIIYGPPFKRGAYQVAGQRRPQPQASRGALQLVRIDLCQPCPCRVVLVVDDPTTGNWQLTEGAGLAAPSRLVTPDPSGQDIIDTAAETLRVSWVPNGTPPAGSFVSAVAAPTVFPSVHPEVTR